MTQKTKIILGILVGGGVIVAVAASFILADLSRSWTSESVLKENENPTAGKKMAFTEFLKQDKGDYKCTVNQDVNGSVTVGTTYLSGGMIRGEYNTQVQNMNVDSTFIVRDGFSYSFTSLAPTMGFKVKVVEPKEGDVTTQTSGSYQWNAQNIGDYDCQPWTVDPAKFTIPTNITFQEIKA